MNCSICGKDVKQGDSGVTLCDGWWKYIAKDESEFDDFDPTGVEYDTCSDCAQIILEFVDLNMCAPYYLHGEDLVEGVCGPFQTFQEAKAHQEFCIMRGDADPGRVITRLMFETLKEQKPDIFVYPPEKDKELK